MAQPPTGWLTFFERVALTERIGGSERPQYSDAFDRLMAAGEAYSEAYTHNEIGSLTSKNGITYNYGVKPHAVTVIGFTNYDYDNNGNMITRGSQTITPDVENRPVTISGGASYVYDGDGNGALR